MNMKIADYRLRREAAAIPLGKLTKSQGEALKSVLSYLRGAVDSSATEDVAIRKSRLLLLSGDRGSGKTSLVLTLRKELEAWQSQANDGEYTSQGGVSDEIKSSIKSLASSVQWLETLSLDPLHRGTNLLSAILARIDAAVHVRATAARATDMRERGLFDPVDALDRARHELANLRSEAVMALEGNLDARASGLDPEGYAISANQAEFQKLQLARQLSSILGRIAAGVDMDPKQKKKIYVLPVDDIDIRPSRAIEMLKLACSLSIPRLFFLFLGSHAILDQVLFSEMQGEFLGLLRGPGAKRAALEQIEVSSNEIASSLLRKLIPPAQRIAIDSMSLAEAFRHSGEERSSDGPTLEELLGKIRWDMQLICTYAEDMTAEALAAEPDKFTSILHSCSLKELLGAPPGENRSHPESYDGASLLSASPRQVADLHQVLEQFVLTETEARTKTEAETNTGSPSPTAPRTEPVLREQGSSDLFRRLVKNFTSLVDEDARLTVPVQNLLKTMFRGQMDGRTGHVTWELDRPEMQVATATGDAMSLEPPRHADLHVNPCKVLARRIRHHDIEVSAPDARGLKTLAPQTRAAFKLLHDLMLLSNHGRISEALPYASMSSVAKTIWDDGISEPLEVPWSVSDWQSFWHLDVFSSYHNHAMDEVSQGRREKAALNDDDFLVALGFHWVSAVVSAVRAKPVGSLAPLHLLKRPAGKWTFLSEDELTSTKKSLKAKIDRMAGYVKLRRAAGYDDREADLIDSMLVELACLAMPEVGLIQFHQEGQVKTTKHARCPAAGKALHELLVGVLEEPYIRANLARRIRRKRLDRIGEHIGTELGLSFLGGAPAAASGHTGDPIAAALSPYNPTPLELQARFFRHSHRGFSAKIHGKGITNLQGEIEKMVKSA